jgi:tetraacyldisaccharide 4'-kinase
VLTNAVNSPVLPVQKPIWRVTRGLRLENPPSRPIVFCAIARPQNFFSQVRTAGIEPAAEISYHDHHAYSESDIANLLALRRQHSANGFLTTEKDAINLGAHLTRLQPLSIAQVTMEFADPMDAVDTMLRIVDERSRRS